MDVRFILGISVLLQLGAALVALWLIRITRRRLAWGLIATAAVLMAARRSVSLLHMASGDLAHPLDLTAELVALATSGILLTGLALVIPLHGSIRRSEEALRESQRTLATLMSNLLGMAYRCRNDRDWTMEFVSEGCLHLTGYQPDDLIGNRTVSYAQLIHPDDRESVWDEVQAALRVKEPFHLVYRIQSAKAEEKWVWEQGQGVFSPSGELLALEGYITDVTDRERAEEALRKAHDDLERRVKKRTADLSAANEQLRNEIAERERFETALRASEEKFRALVETTSDWVWEVDENGIYTYSSPQVTDLLGYRPEDVIGKTPFDFMPPDEAQRVARSFRAIVESREPFSGLENTNLHKDGRQVVLETNGVPIVDAKGKLLGYRGIDRNITGRKRAEAELQQSEKKYRTLLENLPQKIFYKNTESVYVSCNYNYARDLKITPEEIVGKTDYEFYPKELAEKYRADDRRIIKSGGTEEIEEKYLSDGQEFTVQTAKTPVKDEEGKTTGILGIFWDITERKRAAEELRQAKEAAEAASRAKSAFLANMSHEIRTPMTAMLGAAELLAAGRTDQPRDPDRVDIILRNGRHLLALINDLLDLSRAEVDKLEVRRSPCSLLDVMADVEAVTRLLHWRPAVDYRIIYETPAPTRIVTDATRLKQAVINLISNALKFTEIGHVKVRIQVRRDHAEPRLSIAVEDTGAGIPAGDTERIFETFTQIGPGTPGISGGVGLGLPLARWIAEQLGGVLEVTSVKDRGSTFTLRVSTGPLDDAAWVTPGEMSILPKPPSGLDTMASGPRIRGHILLAEDFPDTRKLIEQALTNVGAKVTTVDNGEDAVKVALAEQFDLILMDVRMPGMNGLSATAELRRRGCLTPIIALTASTTEDDRERILKSGFDDLWTKPITLEQLHDEVAAYLRETSEEVGRGDQAGLDRSTATIEDPRLAAARTEFARNLPSRLARVTAAVKARDIDQAREALHQLVGAGGMHGFTSVSQEAARLLELARNGTLAEHPDELEPLKDLVKQAVESVSPQSGTTTG